MGDPELGCPTCGQALGTAALAGGVNVRVCRPCEGTLLAQIDMFRTLEAMSVEMLKSLDPDVHLDPVANKRGTITCPSCKAAMKKDNYCGAGLVFFDRCEPCRLLWLGTEELGTMTLMWARMERRLERVHKATEEMVEHAESFARGVRISRLASRILFHI
jgi:Zn-finger nucleic acid-binding protein